MSDVAAIVASNGLLRMFIIECSGSIIRSDIVSTFFRNSGSPNRSASA